MKFLERLKHAVKITLGELPRNFYFGIIGGGNAMRRASVEMDPYGSLAGWVFFAIDKVSQRVGSIDLELYQLQKNGDLQSIEDHELLNLLYQANPTQTKFDLFYLTAMYLRIWGSAPWFLETQGKKIINIWPLRPDLLRIFQNNEGTITGYEYRLGQWVQNFQPDQIINIRKPSPQNPLRGMSPLFATALEIDADIAAAVWNKFVLENSAEPGGVLTTDGELTDPQFERIKTAWTERYGGPTNAGKTAILENGLKFQKISQTHREMDFTESRKFNRDTILTMLGVPKALVIPDNVNRANSETAERVFSRETIDPTMRLIIDQLNEFLVPKLGDGLWLDYENPVNEDKETERLNAVAATNVWQTVNETRSAFNLPPLDGGDVLYLPLAVQPTVGQGSTPGQEDPTNTEDLPEQEKTLKIITLTKTDKKHLSKKQLRIKNAILARSFRKRKFVSSVVEKVYGKIDTLRKSSGKKMIVKLGYKKKSEEYNDKTYILDPRIETERKMYLKKLPKRQQRFKAVMYKFFDQQEVTVMNDLNNVGEPKGLNVEVKSWIDKILFNRSKQVQVLVKMTTPEYKANVEEGGQDISTLLGAPYEDIVGNPAAADFLQSKPIALAEQVNDTTLQALRDTLAEGVAAGESLGEIGNRISDVFDEARGFRTETIARTEVGSAMNFGRNEQMLSQGVEQKQWLAIFSNTREWHAEAHGQIVNADDNFLVMGEELAYPQDPSGSPENIINCQCSVAPVV